MKVLFVGPYPPPHGGISVHVRSAHQRLKRMGQQSNVLNIDPKAPEDDAYVKISGPLDLVRELVHHAHHGWTFDVHTNGHNAKSWAIALVCGAVGKLGPGATLTLHSGLAPAYIRDAPKWMRRTLRLASGLYGTVICVNREIANGIADLKIPRDRIQIKPAFIPVEPPQVPIPAEIQNWVDRHSPIMTSTLFFRPEYGFELLLEAFRVLKQRHPGIGCLAMGSGENRDDAAALAASYGLGSSVFLAGDLDHELCLSLISRSAVFVRPTFRDGDSISVREAVALGVPVVASDVGTRPESVRLFEPGDVDEFVKQVEEALAQQDESWTRAERRPVPEEEGLTLNQH